MESVKNAAHPVSKLDIISEKNHGFTKSTTIIESFLVSGFREIQFNFCSSKIQTVKGAREIKPFIQFLARRNLEHQFVVVKLEG